MIAPDHPALKKVRAFCLSHPGATERLSHGTPTFFINEKHSFLSLWDNHHNDGRLAICCAAPLGANSAMSKDDPEVFFLPPYVAHLGWLGVRLDRKLPWSEVEELVAGAYAVVAAKHPPKAAKPVKASAKRAPAKARKSKRPSPSR